MERETERERERESGRKQSQRYCDTQRFLVSFWNLMNQTWCLHTHAHTHTHTHTNPTLPVMTTWAYSCQNGLQRKAPKTSTYILSSFELGHPWSPVQTCQHVSPSQECQFFFYKSHYVTSSYGKAPGIHASDRNASPHLCFRSVSGCLGLGP